MALTIAGVPFDSWLSKGSLEFVNALNAEPDTLSFDLVSVGRNGVACPAVVAGSEVLLTDESSTEIFGGVLEAPTEASIKAMVGWSCTAMDWRARINNRTLNTRKRNKTAGQMIVELVASYASIFDTSLVDLGGEVLGSVLFKPPMRMTDALDMLSELTGYIWDIRPDKKVLWSQAGSTVAPFSLTDSSRNYTNLSVTEDRSELKNRVIVIGAKYPASTVTTEYFDGDGVRRHFRPSRIPYSNDDYLAFEDGFSTFDVGSGGKWLQTDVSNPSPPAGHVSADGYLFTTTMSGGALTESGYLQIVGGDGTWGNVRLMSTEVFSRGDGAKRFELDVYAESTSGEGRFGLWDPNNQSALAGEEYGLFFDDGTLRVSRAGSNVGSTLAYADDAWTRIRIIPRDSAGADVYAQTGVNFATRNWTLLHSTTAGTFANFTFAACFNKSFNGRADRARVYNRMLSATVTVDGVEQIVGQLNVDEDSGVDCEIGAYAGDLPVLVFFSDTIPPATAPRNIVFSYNEARQVREGAEDAVSIAEAAALEGTDGVHETWLEDTSIGTPELARTRARQELALYKDGVRSVSFGTRVAGLRAGQVLTINVTTATRSRAVSGQFLITSVAMQSEGGNNFFYSVSATSRLKGAGALLLELLGRGRKFDTASLDDGSTITEMAFAFDLFDWSQSFVIEDGPVGPYVYGGWIETEDGLRITAETGDALLYDGAASYGMAVYS